MSIIPKKIFQSWKTKKLSPELTTNVEKIKNMNPGYEYFLFDDDDCRNFLLKHLGQNYANAFDILIPGAYKCDFWRYAVLYIEGGFYLDMDMVPLMPFDDMIEPKDEFVSIVDLKWPMLPKCGIYQAFIASIPRHPALLYALSISFSNIVTRRHDSFETLNITGPTVMGIGLNLFWNRPGTHDDIVPGQYEGVKLFKSSMNYTYDLRDVPIFQNKFSDYKSLSNYNMSSTYKDDPRQLKRSILRYIFLTVLILAIVGIIAMFVFRGRWKTCEKTHTCESVNFLKQF